MRLMTIMFMLLCHAGYAQISSYDVLIEDSLAALVTRNIYETKESYILFNYEGLAPLFTSGVKLILINKKDGKVKTQASFRGRDYDEIQFNSNSLTLEPNGHIRFISNLNDKIYEFDYDEQANALTIADSITHPLGGGYYDYQHLKVADTTYYHAQSYQPDGSYTNVVIKKAIDTTTFVYMDSLLGYARLGRYMEILPNGNFLIIGSQIPDGGWSGRMTVIEMDKNGKVLSEFASPWDHNSFSTRGVIKLNQDEYIILALALTIKNEEFHFYFNVYRYNHKTKQIIWRHKENKYETSNFGSDGYIIRGHKSGEYLYCSEANAESTLPDSTFTKGQIVKINDEGKTIWNKYYYYTSQRQTFNSFNHIIATSDGHYLAAGTTTPIGFSAWAIKINEDGNIVPIDTLTTTLFSDIEEITIYPNPATDYIIINQGERKDMRYLLYDLSGRLVKSLDIKEAHQHTIWDVGDVPNGVYSLVILHKGQKVKARKLIIN